jgi:2-methylisocitrate lyase-like PEP mutase family enzyme
MTTTPQIDHFRALHAGRTPLVLYNVWDAGSAKAVAEAGMPAVATSSWSVAAAQGYTDGENIAFDKLLWIVARIIASVDVPVTVDFEGGYSENFDDIARNAESLLSLGVAGLNVEDGIPGGRVRPVDEQAARIQAIRAGNASGQNPIFVNARTDLFLNETDASKHPALVAEAIARASAYRAAGADCFFVPGLADESSIRLICEAVDMPVNVMVRDSSRSPDHLAALGVSRISWGPFPYFASQDAFKAAAAALR